MTKSEMHLLQQAASLWGRLGGSVSSPAKASAARRNGKRGGRPGCNGCAAYTGNWPCKCGHTRDDCPYRPSRLRGRGGEKPPAKAALERLDRAKRGLQSKKKT